MAARPQTDVKTLTREQLEAVVVHQDSVIDALIAINNGLQARIGFADTQTNAVLREWSTVVNDTLDASAAEIARILAGDSNAAVN